MRCSTVERPHDTLFPSRAIISIIVPYGSSSARSRERATTTSGFEYAPEVVVNGSVSVCSGTALYPVIRTEYAGYSIAVEARLDASTTSAKPVGACVAERLPEDKRKKAIKAPLSMLCICCRRIPLHQHASMTTSSCQALVWLNRAIFRPFVACHWAP